MRPFATFFRISILFLSMVLVNTSCKEDDQPITPTGSTLKVDFVLVHNGQPMEWDDVVSIPNNVNEFRMDLVKFYISNIKLMQTDGSLSSLKDVILVDFSKPEKTTFSFSAPAGNYDGLKIGVGLDSLLNASDPVSFSTDHPLSAANSMYWTWGTQYRFVMIDGRANKNGAVGSADDLLLAYHPGASEFYSTRVLNNPLTLKNGETNTFTILVELNDFFDGPGGKIDIEANPQTHTVPPHYDLAKNFMLNFNPALSTD